MIHRDLITTKKESGKKPGGQKGHIGSTLKQISEPDGVEIIQIDRRSIPRGHYKELAPEIRQVFDIDISRNVIEYQAQVLQDENGKQFVAPFPDDVTKSVQYGKTLKAHAVYPKLISWAVARAFKVLEIQGFTSYFGFIRSHPTGKVKMFWKVLKIQCIECSQ